MVFVLFFLGSINFGTGMNCCKKAKMKCTHSEPNGEAKLQGGEWEMTTPGS